MIAGLPLPAEIILAAIAGSVLRIIFGYLGEAEKGEPFSLSKAARSLLRGVIGGIVIGVYALNTGAITSPAGAFLATFTGAITVDLIVKNFADAARKR